MILHTTGGVAEEPDPNPEDPEFELDPVIYQSGLPAVPKQSRKEKKAALAADIADGCVVTFEDLDTNSNGSLDADEFSVRRPGAAKPNAKADRNGDGKISFAEYTHRQVRPAGVE